MSNALAYDAYGIPGGGNVERFGYTGQIWFRDLGLFHYKARMYSPTLGRFLQTDPIGYKDDMDLYTYVGNDPVNKTDPTGLYGVGEAQAMAEAHMFFRDPENREGLKREASALWEAAKTGDAEKVGNAAAAAAVVAASARASKVERHHVVPHRDRRASDARDNMRANGLDPKTEKTNLVDISGDKHDITKRESYVTATNDRVAAQDGAEAIKAECCKIANELTTKTATELDKIYPKK